MSSGLQNNTAYIDGRMSFYGEVSWMDCPYNPEDGIKYRAWHQGWADAEQESFNEPRA